MIRRPVWLLLVGLLACPGRREEVQPAPQAPAETVAQFLAAAKANNLRRMGELWGSDQGLALHRMPRDQFDQRIRIIQIYLTHEGYRVLDSQPHASDPQRREFRIELQRSQCTVVFTLTVVQWRQGGWLVENVPLAELGNPARPCPAQAPGT